MNLVSGAIGSLIPKLGELLMEEYSLQKGVREQVRSLSLELESASAAVHKVAEVPPEQLDEQVRIWAREIREASYDMEDVLDTLLVRVQGGDEAGDQVDSLFKRLREKMTSLFAKAKARHEIATAIQDIKKHLEEVAQRRGRYTVDSIMVKPAAASTIDPRLAAIYKEVTQLVGIDKARDELISMLTSPDKKTKTVSIVGVGGLGKTTLAKASYDKIKLRYGCWAFVSVGRNPDLRKVFRDILIDLDKERYITAVNLNILDERQLIDELRQFLEYRRYFIVVDDIWEVQSMEIIKLAFVDNNCGSGVITTTRNFEVASEAHQCYKLQPLSYDSSKELFHKRIYGDHEKIPINQQDEVSAKIVKKCGGVPLAIITMASLLAGKPVQDWRDVYISIGFVNKETRQAENTMRILSFSYYDLPSHLRTCLLYLSVFPEDFTVQKNSLIWKWIGEGFVQKKEGLGLFELGERYFNDLVNRSMIQAVHSEEDEDIIDGCRVHDMVLDFLRSMSCEENFFTILDREARTVSQRKTRRFATYNSSMENQMDMAQVRSFMACRCNFEKWVSIPAFKHLRVLAIENCRSVIQDHLKHLGNLVHLRYLGLTDTYIRELPKEIGNLKFLQTLDLVETCITALPSTVSLLTQLVCLRATILDTIMTDGIAKLTSMEELQIQASVNEKSTRQFLKELGSLRELRVLRTCINHVMDESMHRDLVVSLRNLNKIQHLTVLVGKSSFVVADIDMWEAAGFGLQRNLRELVVEDMMFSRLPLCINPSLLPNLSHLSLFVDAVDENGLKCLGRLPELRYLKLRTWSTVTISNISGESFFRKLRLCSMPSSMVQFVPNYEGTTVSIHLWNGEKDAVPFGSNMEDCSVTLTVMPCVEVLEFALFVRPLKDINVACDNIGLKFLISLQKVKVDVSCIHAYAAEVEKAEAELRQTVEMHPSPPTLEIRRLDACRMIPSIQQKELLQALRRLERKMIPTIQEHEALQESGDISMIPSSQEQTGVMLLLCARSKRYRSADT
ncbi:hypothetical protein EJB05_27836, partial [Eragrostis curvula]